MEILRFKTASTYYSCLFCSFEPELSDPIQNLDSLSNSLDFSAMSHFIDFSTWLNALHCDDCTIFIFTNVFYDYLFIL